MHHEPNQVHFGHTPPLFPDWTLTPLPSAAENVAASASRMAASLQAALPDGLPVLDFPSGKSLHMSGQEDSGSLYLVESGIIKQQVLSSNGKSSIITIFVRHDLIGDSPLIQSTRTDTLAAATPTQLRRIPQAKLMKLVTDPEFVTAWLRYKTCRELERQEQISLFICDSSERRLGWLLLALTCKIGISTRAGILVDNLFTHEEFAQMIGTTRSRVGCFLHGFRTKGLITSRSGTLLIDHRRLQDYLHAVPC